MLIRQAAAAGGFYPYNSNELGREIDGFIYGDKNTKINCIGIVAPHAGYSYCGRTFASVYNRVGGDIQTVVVLGPNHMGIGAGVATSRGIWKTPLGTVEVDEEFSKKMEDELIFHDEAAHRNEHSIEVQLPWIQKVLGDAKRTRALKFVPICINPLYFDKKNCQHIGKRIAEVSKKMDRKILIVASSDFTHYGYRYGYTPFKGTKSEILNKIKEIDMEAAEYAAKIMPNRLIEVCRGKRLSVCGYGAIAAMLYAAKELGAKKGEITDYSTSYEVSRDMSAVVAYCGIVIY